MKATLDRDVLLEGVSLAASVVSNQSPRPILQDVLFRAGKESAELLATDLEVSVRYTVSPIETREEGEVALPAARLLHILREFDDDRVELAGAAGKLRISAGEAEVEIVGHEESAEFPEIPRFASEKAVSLRAGLWLQAVRRTIFAAARDPGRFAVNGALLRAHGGNLLVVATDGKRMAWTKVPLEAGGDSKGSPKDARAVVPVKGLLTLGRAPAGAEDLIPMAVGGGQVAFKIGAAEIFAREIEGEFPSYDTILQRKYGTTVSVAVAALERAVRRAAQVTTEDTHAIRFRFEEGRLLVAADTAAGKARTPVPVEGELPASPVEICFNPDYVLDFLKEAGVESVRFSFQDGGSASMLSTGDEYRYVVMPVTLG